MAGLAGWALFLGRRTSALGAVALSAALLVLWRPALVCEVGFQLSFAATLGIVVLTPALAASWGRLPRWLALPLAVSVAAQISTFPFSLSLVPMVPVTAGAANLIAVPLAACILLQGVLWVVMDTFGLGSPLPDGFVLSSLWNLPAEIVLWLAQRPPSPWLQPLWGFNRLVAFAASVTTTFMLLNLGRRWPLAILLATLLWLPPDRQVVASFLDVGQGASTLLRSPDGAMLVDGGGWHGGGVAQRVLVPVLARARVRRLDSVLLSHGDQDHCQGLLELSSRVAIDQLWLGSAPYDGSCTEELQTRFAGRIRILEAGERVPLGNWQLTVLWDGLLGRTENGRSVVVSAQGPLGSVLLTGDIDAQAERAMAATLSHDSLRSTWLQAAHHGSKTSTSVEFLDAVAPEVVVISAGRNNSYGHPSPVVLRRLAVKQLLVRRIDLLGRVDFDSRELDSPDL